MASLDDILTTQKNGVVAINSINNATLIHAGTYNSKEIAAATTQVIKTTAGWLANVSVIVAGSTQGYLYDTNSGSTLTGNRIYAIPNTLGVYQIQVPFATGLTIVTGTGSVVSVTYS
mgnify:CR=1 FL=1